MFITDKNKSPNVGKTKDNKIKINILNNILVNDNKKQKNIKKKLNNIIKQLLQKKYKLNI